MERECLAFEFRLCVGRYDLKVGLLHAALSFPPAAEIFKVEFYTFVGIIRKISKFCSIIPNFDKVVP